MLNTNPYTYLGNRPLDLSPAATFDRGLVAITFKTLKVGAILGALGGALRGGGMKPSAAVDVQTDLSSLSRARHGARPFPFQLDGDYLGETLELRFEHRPNAVKLRLSLVVLESCRLWRSLPRQRREHSCRSRRSPSR